MNWTALTAELDPHGLFIMGALHEQDDTLVLVGAAPKMWPMFESSAEFSDGSKNPLDRWSKRLLGTIAAAHDGEAVFPSDGPPYLPFIAWAKATGQFWDSPTGMMIHHRAGLMISIRGGLRLPGRQSLPHDAKTSPCHACTDKPCITACPVDALSAHAAYDVPTCKSHITSRGGADCLTSGCLVRRACPVSAKFGREPRQSGFHMRAFVRG